MWNYFLIIHHPSLFSALFHLYLSPSFVTLEWCHIKTVNDFMSVSLIGHNFKQICHWC